MDVYFLGGAGRKGGADVLLGCLENIDNSFLDDVALASTEVLVLRGLAVPRLCRNSRNSRNPRTVILARFAYRVHVRLRTRDRVRVVQVVVAHHSNFRDAEVLPAAIRAADQHARFDVQAARLLVRNDNDAGRSRAGVRLGHERRRAAGVGRAPDPHPTGLARGEAKEGVLWARENGGAPGITRAAAGFTKEIWL